MRAAISALAIAAMFAGNETALAQAYPTRPVTMVVSYPAGGPVDTVGRVLAEGIRARLGQAIIIENVSGASGSIGVGRVARAAPDGYTIVLGIWNTHVANGAVYALPYDVVSDFEPIAQTTSGAQIIVARKGVPAHDLSSFIAWLKVKPDQATAGTSGFGSSQHIFGILFQNAAEIALRFVHYRGGAPAMQDLVAGQIDMILGDLITALPQVRSGTIKAFAVANKSRIAAAPDIPTADEAGLPGFATSVWYGMWAPKGTPKEIITRLNVATVEALADPHIRARLAELGQEIAPRERQTPEALASFQKAEIEKWWPIIKAAGVKLE
jgi:tripartite-type tricarboxylate transporter receptor subunit TctC